MVEALKLAKEAYNDGEIPVGAVIVKDGKIIAKGKNCREKKQNALLHAEIEAINAACEAIGSWRLDGCTIYVTLEPCIMCMGAILNARIDTLVFGAYDLEAGCADSLMNPNVTFKSTNINIYGGISEGECSKLIKDFFGSVRKNEKPKGNNN